MAAILGTCCLWKIWSSHPSSRNSATASSCRDGNLDIAGGMAAEQEVMFAGAVITGYYIGTLSFISANMSYCSSGWNAL